MTNPFSTDALAPNWAKVGEILKYETAGHAFNGNQHTGGIPTGASAQPARRVDPGRWGANDMMNAGRNAEATSTQQSASHNQQAQMYHAMADKATGSMAGKLRDVATAHESAANAHAGLASAARDTKNFEANRDTITNADPAHATGQRMSDAQDKVDAAENNVRSAEQAAGVGSFSEGI